MSMPAASNPTPESCLPAQKAIRFYSARTHYWQARRGSELAERIPWPTCFHARRAARQWQARSVAARRSYERWWAQRGKIIAHLERGLAGTPMAGTGIYLERHGRRYGVSPYFMVAVAATESSIGHAACSSNRKNVWGLASCVNSWPVPYFETWDEAIAFYARFLAERWPGHSSPYSFRGYAACSECWARKVSEWMSRLYGVTPSTRYP